MASIDDVSVALEAAVIELLNTAGGATVYTGTTNGYQFIANPQMQVIRGWPFGTSATEILGNAQAMVSIYPLAESSRTVTDRKPALKTMSQVLPQIEAVITESGYTKTISLSGTPTGGLNIHTILGGNFSPDAYCSTVDGDTLTTILGKMKAAIDALDLVGITTAVVSDTLVVTFTPFTSNPDAFQITRFACNIGGTSTMSEELARVMTPVQISVWAANGDLRNAISKQIENALCVGIQNNFLYAVDGSAIRVRKRGGPRQNDKSQRSYSLYVAHLIYECTYPTLLTVPGAQVEAVPVDITNS